MYFAVADINLNPVTPFLIGLAVSVVSSPAGVSGGFLILPICLNLLGFSSPAVSPTNFIFNAVAMPPGIWRLHREKRLMWRLGGLIMLGCLPGIFAGTVLRCTLLREAADFKIFVALVLAALALSLIRTLVRGGSRASQAERKFAGSPRCDQDSGLNCTISGRQLGYDFAGEHFSVSLPLLTVVCLVTGLIGGIYGIGGAAIIAPLLVGAFQMPIYVAAGASLLAGWASALFGLLSYTVFWPLVSGEPAISPDLPLGLLFGLGGMVGVYTGSALQRYLPATPIKIVMIALILFMAAENFGWF